MIIANIKPMKQIQVLNKPLWLLIDDKHFDRINQFIWCQIGTEDRFTIARSFMKDGKQIRITLANEVMSNYEMIYDHKNQNPLDNQEHNLRSCTATDNSCNRAKVWTGTSIHKGVSWSKQCKKWECRITYKKKTIRIGFFKTEDEAAIAYNNKAKELHGEFAVMNKTNDLPTIH